MESSTGPIGELLIEPFSPVGVNAYAFPQRRVNNTFQFADSLSRAVGDHSLKFGADVRRIQFNSLLDRNYRAQVVYGNAVLTTGTLRPVPFNFEFDPAPDRALLSGAQLAPLGPPSSIFQTVTVGPPDSAIRLRLTEYNLFFNDTWRVRPNFTLDYGLRYEYNSVPREADDRIEDALALNNLPAPNSRADTPQRTAAFNAAVEAYRRATGGRTRIYDPDRNNFGPHLGFAWSPGTDGRTVIRGGYGIYYDTILGAVVSQSRNVFPNEIPINVEPGFTAFDAFQLNNPAFIALLVDGRPLISLLRQGSNQFGGGPGDVVAAFGELFRQNRLGGGLAFTLPEKELRTPYAQHWHLTVERQLADNYAVSVAYVGTKGTKLTRFTTPNLGPNVTPSILIANRFVDFPPGFEFPQPLVLADCRLQPSGRCSFAPPRPEPNLGAYQIFENSASSTYHALQTELRRRYAQGFQFALSYTWAHAIDDVSDIFIIAGAPILPQDSFNLRAERGDANFDLRHRVTASFIWDLPFCRDAAGAAGALLGGWQAASTLQTHSGQPFTLNLPVDANFDGNLTDRPATTGGLIFFDGHGARKVAVADGRRLEDFFVFGQNGAVGRNTVRADGLINWDVALNKAFRFSERQSLLLRAEVFNVLNRANYGIPIRVLGNPAFGAAVETATPARQVQFALKYSF